MAEVMFNVMRDESHAVTPERASKVAAAALEGLVIFRRDSNGDLIIPEVGLEAIFEQNWKISSKDIRRQMLERKRCLFPPKGQGQMVERKPEPDIEEMLAERKARDKRIFMERFGQAQAVPAAPKPPTAQAAKGKEQG